MVITLLIPLLLLSGLGWGLAKFSIIRSPQFDAVGDLTIKILIPSLLLMGMYNNGLPKDVSISLLLAYYLPFILLFLLLVFLFNRDARKAQLSFAAVYANTVFIGIPVIVQVLGEASLRFAFPIIAFHSLVGFALYYLTDSFNDGLSNILSAIKKTFRSPIVLSLLLGLLLNTLGVTLPSGLTKPLTMLGQAALPCALLVLGASLSQYKIVYTPEALIILLAKLIVLPALVLASALYIFQLPNEVTTVLLILATGPVGINAYILAFADKKAVDSVSSVILLSSVLYVLSFSVWLWLASQLGLCC